ncbi:MAG TPA: hypothetical protein VMU50_06325 [Polyangia bacterium]|nr:hypothetical protein [Polyangia bacterium]
MSDGNPHPFARPWMFPGLTGAAIAGSLALLLFARGASTGGQPVALATTVVPTDAADLDCDAADGIGQLRCALRNGRRDPGVGRPLRPFVTVQGEPVLLSGVFESPAVARWLAAAQGAAKQRVTLDCVATFAGTLEEVGVHWRRADPFVRQHGLRAAVVQDCTIRGAR